MPICGSVKPGEEGRSGLSSHPAYHPCLRGVRSSSAQCFPCWMQETPPSLFQQGKSCAMPCKVLFSGIYFSLFCPHAIPCLATIPMALCAISVYLGCLAQLMYGFPVMMACSVVECPVFAVSVSGGDDVRLCGSSSLCVSVTL